MEKLVGRVALGACVGGLLGFILLGPIGAYAGAKVGAAAGGGGS